MNITIEINDSCCTDCFKNVINSTETFTASSQTFELQGNFLLNVISADETTFLVIVQNGNCVILRKIIRNVETSILIPSCATHILTLTSN